MTTVAGATDGVGTLRQSERRDVSGVDYGEAMRRASAIVPTFRERAQRSEDARILLRDNEQLLHETGLFRFHQPRAFGGMELPFVDIVTDLGRGCPSMAWNVGNLGAHHWILGFYTRDPLQRHLRDVLAINQHFSFNFDIAGSAYGLQVLGGAFASPTM